MLFRSKHRLDEFLFAGEITVEQGLRDADAACQFARLHAEPRFCKIRNRRVKNLLPASGGVKSDPSFLCLIRIHGQDFKT